MLAAGGTAYYQDPEIGDTGYGLVELEGLRNSRIYNPDTNRWTQTGSMAVGRWYPSLVTLGNGRVFVASGVEKLVKPVYPDHPLDSFANVRKTETYDPATGKWTDNGTTGARSLPLFPRLHLLPNGHVYYNAAGQAFNPFGQSYDEALWNIAASYDPAAGRWKELGVPGVDGGSLTDLLDLDFGAPVSDLAKLGIPGGGKSVTIPGFRGSTFSIMLPLEPDALGRYSKAVLPHRRRRGRTRRRRARAATSRRATRASRPWTPTAATRSRRSRPATCTGRAGTRPACSCPRARRSPSRARTATRWPFPARSSRSSRRSSGARRPATGPPWPRRTGRGPTTTPRCSCPTGAS